MLGSIAFNYWMGDRGGRVPRNAGRGAPARVRRHGQPRRPGHLQVRELLRRQRQRRSLRRRVSGRWPFRTSCCRSASRSSPSTRISYVIDVSARDAVAQKSPVHAALYLLLFPQLIRRPDSSATADHRRSAPRAACVDGRLRLPAFRRFVDRARQEGADCQRGRPARPIRFLRCRRPSCPRRDLARHRLLPRCRSTSTSPAIPTWRSVLAGCRLPVSGEFPLAVRGDQRDGVLAPLAYLAVDLVPRLSLHPARRQPREPGAPLTANLVTVFFPLRPVARRELELSSYGACGSGSFFHSGESNASPPNHQLHQLTQFTNFG